MKGWVRKALVASGVAAVGRRVLGRTGVFVLEFHGTPSRRYPELPSAIRPDFTAGDLERVLGWLAERFAFLTPDQAFEPGARGVLLTFDDGFANNVKEALPLLERFGAPAIFFVTLQHLEDSGNWLPSVRRQLEGSEQEWPEEIRQDLFDGMNEDQLRLCVAHPLISIGSHTLHHPRLSECEDPVLGRELEGSCLRLEELGGQPVKFFAYPYGDYDRRVAEAVRDAGYRAAFVEDSRQVGLPAFEIPRVGLYSSEPSYLALKLSGFHRRPWGGLDAAAGGSDE